MEDKEDILNKVLGSDVIGVVGDFNIIVGGMMFNAMSLLFDEEEDTTRYEEQKKERKWNKGRGTMRRKSTKVRLKVMGQSNSRRFRVKVKCLESPPDF